MPCVALAVALLMVLGVAPLDAAPRGPGASYTASLSGGEEAPPRATPGSGQATFQVSADGQALTYSVTVRDITNVRMGHIHLGPRGANGDIVLSLLPPGGGPSSGVIGQGTATAAQLVGPLQGKTMADLVAALDTGNAYVNIHTGSGASPATLQPGDLPPGEIRGQIVLVSTAAPAAGATATRTVAAAVTATAPAAATATRPAQVPATATAPAAPTPPPATMPNAGGGYGGGLEVGLRAALAALLAIGVALALGVRRRA